MTLQELKEKHPEIYSAWYQEGYDKGVALGREEGIKNCRAEMLAAAQAARKRSTGERLVDAWMTTAFPNGLTIT